MTGKMKVASWAPAKEPRITREKTVQKWPTKQTASCDTCPPALALVLERFGNMPTCTCLDDRSLPGRIPHHHRQMHSSTWHVTTTSWHPGDTAVTHSLQQCGRVMSTVQWQHHACNATTITDVKGSEMRDRRQTTLLGVNKIWWQKQVKMWLKFIHPTTQSTNVDG